MLEFYAQWVATLGESKARLRYGLTVLKLLRPFAKRKTLQYPPASCYPAAMIRNHFTVAWRNLARNRAFTIINMAGLAIGLASCLLIVLYVGHELSYDRYHQKANRIYRMTSYGKLAGKDIHTAYVGAPAGPAW
jgi:putative ABC transport system permease protein